jgi:hypothetical protein
MSPDKVRQLIPGVGYVVVYAQRNGKHGYATCMVKLAFVSGGKTTSWLASNGSIRRIKASDIHGVF